MKQTAITDTNRSLTRGEATQLDLMFAAEKLFAERGVSAVTAKEVLAATGQKNKSALQYHFGDMQGLIRALKARRSLEIRERRALLLQQLSVQSAPPSVRDICELMIRPPLELARETERFRNYVKAFGSEVALNEGPAGSATAEAKNSEFKIILDILRQRLDHLSKPAFQFRFDAALRLSASAIVHHAHQKNAFRGKTGAFFLTQIVDALEGLLLAPES